MFGNQDKTYLEELVRNTKNSFKALGYEKISVTGTVASLTPPVGSRYCEIRLISTITTSPAAMYLMLGDKTLPTSTDGMPMNNGDFFDITDFHNVNGFRIIQTGAGTHTIYVQYYY